MNRAPPTHNCHRGLLGQAQLSVPSVTLQGNRRQAALSPSIQAHGAQEAGGLTQAFLEPRGIFWKLQSQAPNVIHTPCCYNSIIRLSTDTGVL